MKTEKKQNFISVDGKTARNSYDEFFTIGEVVAHQDESVGEATILRFKLSLENNEIVAYTNRGCAHIDFLIKT